MSGYGGDGERERERAGRWLEKERVAVEECNMQLPLKGALLAMNK